MPIAGKQRSTWLRERLVRLLQEDTAACDVREGAMAETLLACFERVTGQAFTDSLEVAVTSRVCQMRKVMGHLTEKQLLDQPLLAAKRDAYRCGTGSRRCRWTWSGGSERRRRRRRLWHQWCATAW